MIDSQLDGPDSPAPGGIGVCGSGGSAGSGPAERPRSRTVLYISIAVAVVIGVFVCVLAAAKPTSNGTTTDTLVGKPAPDVSGPALTGSSSYSLSDYSGKWVVVNFSASWCVPCVQETSQLQTFYTEHSKTGDAVVLAVEFDATDVSHLASFLAKRGAEWPAINDPSAEVAYGVSQIPQSFLVSPTGVVAAKFFGAVTSAELDQTISQDSGSA